MAHVIVLYTFLILDLHTVHMAPPIIGYRDMRECLHHAHQRAFIPVPGAIGAGYVCTVVEQRDA